MNMVLRIVGIVLLTLVGCEGEQAAIDQGPVVLHQEYSEPGSDEPFSGERVIHNESLNLKQKAQYVDGYPEKVIYYDINEQKKTEIIVADEGKGEVKTHTQWYKSGQKKFEHRENTLREWHENGQLKAEVPYDENGDLNGITKKWDADGELEAKEEYKHGTLVDNADL